MDITDKFPPKVDVAVVGAGPAGSSMAAALAGQGWEVLLIERDRFPRHKVCGEFLSPEAQGSLRHLGLLNDTAALRPASLSHAELTTPPGNRLRLTLPGAAWGLSRWTFDVALAEAAVRCGARLWQGITVTACHRHSDGYQLSMRRQGKSSTLSARALIIACGRHSLPGLPPQASPAKTQVRPWRRCVGLKCHYEQVKMPPQVELFLFPGGYVGINPIEGGQANVCMLISYDAFVKAGKSVIAAIAAAAAWNPSFARRLAGGRPLLDTACAVAPVDTRRRARPWAGAACVGDTAAMIPPLCGDGMAMALRSAELCAPLADAYLHGKLSLEAWAEAYATAWRHEFEGRLRTGRVLQTLLGTSRIGDGLISLGRRLPALADYLVRATRGNMG